MAVIQKFLGHYFHPWFAHPWFINPPKPNQPREEGGEGARQVDRTREGSATPPNEARRRASAPEWIALTGLRPPSQENGFSSSFASIYNDAVSVRIASDDDSDN